MNDGRSDGLGCLGKKFRIIFFDQKTQARIMHVHTSNPSLSDIKSVGSQEEEQAFHLHQSSQCTNTHTHTGMAIDYCSDIGILSHSSRNGMASFLDSISQTLTHRSSTHH